MTKTERRRKLRQAHKEFCKAMWERLEGKLDRGWDGWDEGMPRKGTIVRILDNLLRDEEDGEVDAGNLSMMLWHKKEPTHEAK